TASATADSMAALWGTFGALMTWETLAPLPFHDGDD
ncbi:MAG: hypothetical protein RLZZ544_35, partial [Actinomycetota bacterium]